MSDFWAVTIGIISGSLIGAGVTFLVIRRMLTKGMNW